MGRRQRRPFSFSTIRQQVRAEILARKQSRVYKVAITVLLDSLVVYATHRAYRVSYPFPIGNVAKEECIKYPIMPHREGEPGPDYSAYQLQLCKDPNVLHALWNSFLLSSDGTRTPAPDGVYYTELETDGPCDSKMGDPAVIKNHQLTGDTRTRDTCLVQDMVIRGMTQ